MENNFLTDESEIRRDYRTNFYTLIAPGRSKRPIELEEEDTDASNLTACPFERGNESQSKEIMHYGEPWTLRVIENKFPELTGNTPLVFKKTDKGVIEYFGGYGYNEIVIFSPNHTDTLEGLDNEAGLAWLNALVEREDALYARKYIKYVQVFHNYGATAGASFRHPHTQIIAWPILIGNIKRELDIIKMHKVQNNSCLYEDIYEIEKTRLLLENKNFFAIAPFGSRITAESMIVPKRHVNCISELTTEEKNDLFSALKTILLTNKKLYGRQAYNFTIHELKEDENIHMHLELYPRMSIQAGIEIGEDVFVNKISPEEYSENFRNSLVVSD